jgi:hypothetical protein
VIYLYMGACCKRGCATKHHLLHRCTAARCMALRSGMAAGRRAGLCAMRCGRRGIGCTSHLPALAGVLRCVGVQPEHRQLEHGRSDGHGGGMRPCAFARMRRATDVLLAAVVPAASGPRRRCGDGPPWMWASPGADVGVSSRRCG